MKRNKFYSLLKIILPIFWAVAWLYFTKPVVKIKETPWQISVFILAFCLYIFAFAAKSINRNQDRNAKLRRFLEDNSGKEIEALLKECRFYSFGYVFAENLQDQASGLFLVLVLCWASYLRAATGIGNNISESVDTAAQMIAAGCVLPAPIFFSFAELFTDCVLWDTTDDWKRNRIKKIQFHLETKYKDQYKKKKSGTKDKLNRRPERRWRIKRY